MKMQMEVVVYKCSKCSAEDHVRYEIGEANPPQFNCNKCGAGRGKDTSDSIYARLGMFPQSRTLEAK